MTVRDGCVCVVLCVDGNVYHVDRFLMMGWMERMLVELKLCSSCSGANFN